jgi:adenosylcobinamide-GDP ribazoletransferase
MDFDSLGRKFLDGLVACFGFYTRLPVSAFSRKDANFAEAQWATPVVGLVVGLIGWLVFWFFAGFDLPSTVSAALALSAILVVTGCLHEDGVADMTDAFGGGNTRERKLEIMKDSRNGTFGVVALMMDLLLRWAAMAALVTPGVAFAGLLAAHAGSRALFPIFMHLVNPAKTTGLAAGIGTVSRDNALYAAIIAILVMLLSLGLWPTVAGIGALAAWLFFMKGLTERQIGGHTGDVLGSVQQGGEIILLLVACSALV